MVAVESREDGGPNRAGSQRNSSVAVIVEVNMKIPSLTLKTTDEADRVINNSDIRFAKLIDVTATPKAGTVLDVTVRPDVVLQCTVTRADWEEERAIFVVSCQSRRSKTASRDYRALINDPDWRRKQLP
jgi:hypothetical protein